jgi:hypothetical protein
MLMYLYRRLLNRILLITRYDSLIHAVEIYLGGIILHRLCRFGLRRQLGLKE